MEQYIKENRVTDFSITDKIQRKVITKLGEIGLNSLVRNDLTHDDLYIPPSNSLKLVRGSRFGEDGMPRMTMAAIPISGYFEFRNKTNVFCAIKILLPGGDPIWEIPR